MLKLFTGHSIGHPRANLPNRCSTFLSCHGQTAGAKRRRHPLAGCAAAIVPDETFSSGLECPRILLVEGEEILRSLISSQLTKAGFKALLAPGAEEGFRRATRESPEVIILDWMMPGEAGDSPRRRARVQGFTCPIVMLTFNGDPASQVAGLEGGGDTIGSSPSL
jgi:CheY-like chemotaxis protein